MRTWMLIVGAVYGVSAYAQYVKAPPLPDEVPPPAPLSGVTFDDDPSKVFVPVREVGPALGVYVGWDSATKSVTFDKVDLPDGSLRSLFDGSNMVDLRGLAKIGYKVVADATGDGFSVTHGKRTVQVKVPDKWVEVSLDDQTLTAWQGDRLVMITHVSTGRVGFETPPGEYKAGPEKVRMRYSKTYDNSPMPYAVQLAGGYYVHGYTHVPKRPASHGCIRMPLTGRNAAEYFFEWVSKGTPVSVRRDWSDRAANLLEKDTDASALPAAGSR